MIINTDFIYPIGAIYISTSSKNPEVLFGGKWEQIKDKFLLTAGDTYTAGGTGGSSIHSHQYGFQYGGYYRHVALEGNSNAGLLNYNSNNGFSVTGPGISQGSMSAPTQTTTAYEDKSFSHYRIVANTSYTSTLPPYLTVYAWKRVA